MGTEGIPQSTAWGGSLRGCRLWGLWKESTGGWQERKLPRVWPAGCGRIPALSSPSGKGPHPREAQGLALCPWEAGSGSWKGAVRGQEGSGGTEALCAEEAGPWHLAPHTAASVCQPPRRGRGRGPAGLSIFLTGSSSEAGKNNNGPPLTATHLLDEGPDPGTFNLLKVSVSRQGPETRQDRDGWTWLFVEKSPEWPRRAGFPGREGTPFLVVVGEWRREGKACVRGGSLRRDGGLGHT